MVGFLLMLLLYWLVPVSLPSHKPVLTDKSSYLPDNGMEIIVTPPKDHSSVTLRNYEPFGCNPMTITMDLEKTLHTDNHTSIVFTLEQGYFLLVDENPQEVIIVTDCLLPQIQASDCIAFRG